MKVFISCDMEGVAGIVDWAQCRPDGGAAYERGCALMLAEVNASIAGALEGGATEVVVNDSHGAMANLDLRLLTPPATYISGRHKPGYMMQGLDDTYGAVFFVGYHGSISGAASVLSHTYNPDVISGVRLGGAFVGESGVNALVAHASGVPVALVTGDSVTIDEARSFAPDHIGVEVKESVTRFGAHHLRPDVALERIRLGAQQAVVGVLAGRIAPPVMPTDIALDVDLQTADMAAVAAWVKGVERSGTRSVRVTGHGPGGDGAAVYDAFVALTYITRQTSGR